MLLRMAYNTGACFNLRRPIDDHNVVRCIAGRELESF